MSVGHLAEHLAEAAVGRAEEALRCRVLLSFIYLFLSLSLALSLSLPLPLSRSSALSLSLSLSLGCQGVGRKV